MRICQNCKTRNVDESVFCRKCGTKIEENPFICPDCLFENTDDSMFCIKCGTKLAVGGNAKSTIASAASNRTAGYNYGIKCIAEGHAGKSGFRSG